MLVSWASVTEMFCDVRSDSVRAISVTLRSTATPDENSTVPKNSTSIRGTTMANSIGGDTPGIAGQIERRAPHAKPDSSSTHRFAYLVLTRFLDANRVHFA